MNRELHHIPLADLKLSKLNVRRHGVKDIGSLAASIAALGLIQPLLVRGNGEGYEIVAGQRRYLAMKKLNAEGVPETDTLPCVVMDATGDAAAIESSLAENLARLPMDEIDQYEAFAALKKQGLDEADIAAHFAIAVQVVRRRLAIATLHPDIRRLYRAGEIDAKTLHLLTLATKERQKAWLALSRDPEQTPPPPWQLKAWLLGGAEISTQAALFDEALYEGAIAADLFGEERYFTDPDEFWCLQNAAIAAERERCSQRVGPRFISSNPTGASSCGTTIRRQSLRVARFTSMSSRTGMSPCIRACCPAETRNALCKCQATAAMLTTVSSGQR